VTISEVLGNGDDVSAKAGEDHQSEEEGAEVGCPRMLGTILVEGLLIEQHHQGMGLQSPAHSLPKGHGILDGDPLRSRTYQASRQGYCSGWNMGSPRRRLVRTALGLHALPSTPCIAF
jgi:hypothetical protein